MIWSAVFLFREKRSSSLLLNSKTCFSEVLYVACDCEILRLVYIPIIQSFHSFSLSLTAYFYSREKKKKVNRTSFKTPARAKAASFPSQDII